MQQNMVNIRNLLTALPCRSKVSSDS